MPLRGGHGVILFIALIERRYVLFMEKTSENTVQVWKNKKIKHWMLIAFFLCFYDIVAVNLSYIFGLYIGKHILLWYCRKSKVKSDEKSENVG